MIFLIFGICCFCEEEVSKDLVKENVDTDEKTKEKNGRSWRSDYVMKFSLNYDYNLKFVSTFGFGYGYVNGSSNLFDNGLDRYGFGAMLQINPGVSGGKASLALGGFGSILYGLYLKMTYLRTWNDPYRLENDSNYLGPEVEINFFMFHASIGYFKKFEGGHLVDEGEINFSVGIGMNF